MTGLLASRKRILIIKTGATRLTTAGWRGDFENWILVGLQVGRDHATIANVCNGDYLPEYSDVCGVVITGSEAMVTDHHEWSERTATWLRGAVEEDIPTLGICYGHQLLAYAMGGEVDDNPNGLEVGTVEVCLNEAARDDHLLAGFPNRIRVQAWHKQSVTRLPRDARLLAWSAMDAHHAYALGERAWGVQFHPEFSAEIMIEYFHQERQALQKQGVDPDQLIRDCVETRFGPDLLRRFAEIVGATPRET